MKTKTYIVSVLAMSFLALTACGSHHNHSDHHDHESLAEAHSEHGDAHDHDSHEGEHGTHEETHPGEVHFTEAQAQACGLELETIKPAEFHSVIKTSGRIEPLPGKEKTVVAHSNGTISLASKGIFEGVEVKKGDVLYYVSASELAEGDQMAKAKAEFDAAEKQYRRAEALVADKIISEQEFEQARTRYELARASYQRQAGNYSDRGVAVTAPSDGFVVSVLKSAGEYVQTGDAVCVISDNNRLALCADVPESDYRFLSQIRTANFKTVYDDSLYSLSDLNGRVTSYSRTAQGAYVQIYFDFENKPQLASGSYAEVFLIGKAQSNCISVPVSALIEEQGIMSVFVLEEEDIYRKQEVVLGQSDGQRVAILNGLKEGDQVVVKGAYNVKLATASSAIPGHTHNH